MMAQRMAKAKERRNSRDNFLSKGVPSVTPKNRPTTWPNLKKKDLNLVRGDFVAPAPSLSL
jgi:hypothetical protein